MDAEESEDAVKAAEKNSDMIPQLDGPPENTHDLPAPENIQFKCEQCSFKAITSQMVKYHTRIKHRTHHCEPGFEEYVFQPNGICPLPS